MNTFKQDSQSSSIYSRYKDSTTYNILNKYKKPIIAFLLVIFLLVVGEIVLGNFFTLTQILAILKLASFIAFFSLSQMIVMATGGSRFDLSVGYAATLTAVVTAGIMDGKNGNLWKAVLVAIALGIAIGLANGVLTAYVKLPPLIVTMAMASILQGIVNAFSSGRNIAYAPSPILVRISAYSTGKFPNIIFVLIVVAAIAMIILYRTKWGLILFGVGANETTAYLSGINVKMVRCVVYVIGGVLACLTGLLIFGNMGIAFKDMASSYIFPSVIAVVIGGVSMNGGDGNYLGVILGAIFLQALSNLLVALNLGDSFKWITYGLLLYFLLIAYVGERRRR